MIYLTTDSTRVQMIHYMPFDGRYGMGKTEQELAQTGFLIEDEVPTYSGEPLLPNQSPELHYDAERGFWFEVITNKITEGNNNG